MQKTLNVRRVAVVVVMVMALSMIGPLTKGVAHPITHRSR